MLKRVVSHRQPESAALPASAPVPAAPHAPAPAGEVAEPQNGKTILIVEDEQPLAHAMLMKLKNEGYAATVAANGADALVLLEKGGYDLILLDLIMPHMDGFSVLEQLKARKMTVPVIVLSNLGQDEDKAKAKEFGVLDYFVKSNTPISDIIQRIKSLC